MLSYIARTGLREPIVFTDCYDAKQVAATSDPIQVWDPVNPENNVARTYTDDDRRRLVEHTTEALEQVAWAAMAPTKGDANNAWRSLLGPTFQGA